MAVVTTTPVTTIDLRHAPEKRWGDFGYEHRFVIRDLLERTRTEAVEAYGVLRVRAAEFGLGKLANAYNGHEYVRELEGLAVAASVPLRDLYLANITYDIASYFMPKGQPIGCTGMIHGGPPSPMISRNMDWVFPGGIGEHSTLFRFVDDHGEYLSVGFPGITGVISAISSHGFALTVNQAPHESMPSFTSLPALWLTRLAMDAGDSFDAALKVITTTPAATSFYLLLAGSEPSEAVRIASRGSSDDIMSVGKGHYAVVANHEPGEEQEYESDEGDSYHRYLTLEEGGASVVSGDVTAAKHALSKWPVCHDNTVHQMVMVPAKGELHLRCPHRGQRRYTRHCVG
jgi:hypothetical protein